MRYQPQHKMEVHRKIVRGAARRVRAEGLTGAAVSAIMSDSGLTHGGFYKHFASKNRLLIESLHEAFRQIADTLARAARNRPPATAWKAIVDAYLSTEHCDHAECGCPLAALAPELARASKPMKLRLQSELENYKTRLLPFMPGRTIADKERAFLAIISTMLGAVAIARVLPDPASRARVLANARGFLLRRFQSPSRVR